MTAGRRVQVWPAANGSGFVGNVQTYRTDAGWVGSGQIWDADEANCRERIEALRDELDLRAPVPDLSYG